MVAQVDVTKIAALDAECSAFAASVPFPWQSNLAEIASAAGSSHGLDAAAFAELSSALAGAAKSASASATEEESHCHNLESATAGTAADAMGTKLDGAAKCTDGLGEATSSAGQSAQVCGTSVSTICTIGQQSVAAIIAEAQALLTAGNAANFVGTDKSLQLTICLALKSMMAGILSVVSCRNDGLQQCFDGICTDLSKVAECEIPTAPTAAQCAPTHAKEPICLPPATQTSCASADVAALCEQVPEATSSSKLNLGSSACATESMSRMESVNPNARMPDGAGLLRIGAGISSEVSKLVAGFSSTQLPKIDLPHCPIEAVCSSIEVGATENNAAENDVIECAPAECTAQEEPPQETEPTNPENVPHNCPPVACECQPKPECEPVGSEPPTPDIEAAPTPASEAELEVEPMPEPEPETSPEPEPAAVAPEPPAMAPSNPKSDPTPLPPTGKTSEMQSGISAPEAGAW